MTLYRQSVEFDRQLTMQIEGYHSLDASIARAAAPGKDVFASADAALEAEHHREAMAAYRDTVAEIRQTIAAANGPAPVRGWPAVLDQVDASVAELSSAVRATLALYRAGRHTDALAAMADLVRLHDEIRLDLRPVLTRAQDLQRGTFDRQHELTAALRIAEYLIGTIIGLFFLVLLLTGYRRLRGTAQAQGDPNVRPAAPDGTEVTEPAAIAGDVKSETPDAGPNGDPRTTLFATASHDLRQPLHAISLHLDLLSDRIGDPEAMATIEAIDASIISMQSMLDSLLEASKLDAGMVEKAVAPVALLDIFDQLAVEAAPQAARNQIELRVVPNNIWVESDTILLLSMLRHLLSNALRYTQAGRVLVGARRRGDRVFIEVWDTGPGISEDAQSRMFEDFFQSAQPAHGEKPGIGLGLAIVDRLARLLNHSVSVRSRPGRGTMFRIETAVARPPAIDSNAAGRPRTRGGSPTPAVLLIADSRPTRIALAAMLAAWDYEVVTASATDEALELVAGRAQPPEIIVIDLGSRKFETEFETVRSIIRTTGRRTPALIVTADPEPAHDKDALDCELMLVRKPIVPDEFRRALEGLVSNSGADGADNAARIAIPHTLTEGLR